MEESRDARRANTSYYDREAQEAREARGARGGVPLGKIRVPIKIS